MAAYLIAAKRFFCLVHIDRVRGLFLVYRVIGFFIVHIAAADRFGHFLSVLVGWPNPDTRVLTLYPLWVMRMIEYNTASYKM